jgi:hypothetical protein
MQAKGAPGPVTFVVVTPYYMLSLHQVSEVCYYTAAVMR